MTDDTEVKVNFLHWWFAGRSPFGAVFYLACILVYMVSLPLMVMMVADRAPWWITAIVVIGNLGAVLAHMSQLDAIEGLLNRLVRRQQVSLADLSKAARASQD